MGQDDLHASLAHVVLACVAGQSTTRYGHQYVHPGMHINFLVHGVLGFMHHQSGLFNNDFSRPYAISLLATRYLPLPCLMADLYRGDRTMCIIHLVSGVVPFTLALVGNDNPQLGSLMIACNIISLCHYSLQNNREYGWYTAVAAILSYYMTPQLGPQRIIYPLCLALMEYCSIRLHYTGFQ